MFKRKEDKHDVKYFKRKASATLANGSVVNVDSNGYLIQGTATSVNHVGVYIGYTVAATDSDYASTPFVPVDMARPNDLFIADVSAGTIAQTAVGAYYDMNSTGTAVDLSSTTTKQVYVQDILSASSQVVVMINSMAGVDETG